MEKNMEFGQEEFESLSESKKCLTFNEKMTEWGKEVFGTASLGSIFLVFLFGFLMAWMIKPSARIQQHINKVVKNPSSGPDRASNPFFPFIVTRIHGFRILLTPAEPELYLEQCPSDKTMACFQVKDDPSFLADILGQNKQKKGASR